MYSEGEEKYEDGTCLMAVIAYKALYEVRVPWIGGLHPASMSPWAPYVKLTVTSAFTVWDLHSIMLDVQKMITG